MTTKLLGKDLIVEWTPSGGSLVSIATKSRNFKVSQKGNEIDVTVREDVLADFKDTLVDSPDRTAELSGLDTDVNAPDWVGVEVNDVGTLVWYRRGKVSGRPMYTATAICVGSDFGSPHDGANDWTLNWKLTSAVVPSTYT